MNPLLNIRRNVLGVTQEQLSLIAGVSQPVISRIEAGKGGTLNADHMRAIREHAIAAGKAWDDRLFFEVIEPAALAPSIR